jgi:hypothetical protein
MRFKYKLGIKQNPGSNGIYIPFFKPKIKNPVKEITGTIDADCEKDARQCLHRMIKKSFPGMEVQYFE